MASIEGKGPNGAQIAFPEWVGSDTTGAALRRHERGERARRKAALDRLRREWDAQSPEVPEVPRQPASEGEDA